jgi:CRISPR type IV-associated protein Csf2
LHPEYSIMTTIDVTLKLTSPLHLAYPGNAEKDREGRNVSRTFKKTVLVGGTPVGVPCVPGNGLRGALRRKAAARLMSHLCEGDQSIPADLYLGLTCGASSGSPDSTPLSVEELLRARQNIYMGVFGGGARLLQSTYRVSDINPVLKDTLEAGVVPTFCADYVQPKARREPGADAQFVRPWELLDLFNPIRKDDVVKVARVAELRAAVGASAVAEYQATVARLNAERKAESTGKETVANLMQIEALCAGTPMHFRIDLRFAPPELTEKYIGMLLLCLSDLFNENALGGWCRAGMGQYRVDTLRVSAEGNRQEWTDLYTDDVFRLPETLTGCIIAAEEALQSVTTAEMIGYFTDFSAAKKATAKAKARSERSVAEA